MYRLLFFRQDTSVKDHLAARGFVSDVTVKRREEALLVSIQGQIILEFY